jgi:hypothetical protein
MHSFDLLKLIGVPSFLTIRVWLYSAIRPRYGKGPKTALITGLFLWVMGPLTLDAILGAMQLFPAATLVADALTGLAMFVLATLVGAWVYKEQSQ